MSQLPLPLALLPGVECDNCGACCTSLIIEIDEADLIREPLLIGRCDPIKIPPGMVMVDDETGEEVPETIPGYGAGALLACGKKRPCPMHVGDRCTIHATKPACCAEFEAGSKACQRARYYASLPPLGGGDWPADDDEFAAFVGEDY